MAPKRKVPKSPPKIPDGLEDLIKKAISEAFPLLPINIAKEIKLSASKLGGIDYQFFIKHIVTHSRLEPIEVTEKISEKVSENNLIKSLTVSSNGSFINISTKIPSKCNACSIQIKLGRQPLIFRPTGMKICDRIEKELLLRRSLRTNVNEEPNPIEVHERKETTLGEKISDNFRVHLGSDCYVYDVKKAVQDVAKRDYPQFDLTKIPPTFIPSYFLSKCPEALDYERYIKELKILREKIENEYPEVDQLPDSELLNQSERVKQLEHVIGELAEKQAYSFLKECIIDEEVVVINNFKVMTVEDLDEIATDFEKDFVILSLTKRFIMSLEVKANCNKDSLQSACKQLNGCKALIEKWCGADLTEENGWCFLSAVYFQSKPEDFSFCENCAKFLIFGDEFVGKYNKINENIPYPMPDTEHNAREEFKNVINHLLFMASFEPVTTPRQITNELVKMLEKAGDLDNIFFWNQIFCLTPSQLGLLKDESLKRVLFLSPPSCGKTQQSL